MTKKDLLYALSDRYFDAVREYAKTPCDSQEELAAHLAMKAWSDAFDLVAGAVNAAEQEAEPEPPKKARRINLTNKDGDWRWSVWQEEEPGSWGKVYSHARFYASVAEAAEDAERWLRNNP